MPADEVHAPLLPSRMSSTRNVFLWARIQGGLQPLGVLLAHQRNIRLVKWDHAFDMSGGPSAGSKLCGSESIPFQGVSLVIAHPSVDRDLAADTVEGCPAVPGVVVAVVYEWAG